LVNYRPRGWHNPYKLQLRDYLGQAKKEAYEEGADAYGEGLKKEPVTVIRVNDCVVGYLVYIPEGE